MQKGPSPSESTLSALKVEKKYITQSALAHGYSLANPDVEAFYMRGLGGVIQTVFMPHENQSAPNLIHEMVHAWNDLTGNPLALTRDDEGMAYLLQHSIDPLEIYLLRLEKDIQEKSCNSLPIYMNKWTLFGLAGKLGTVLNGEQPLLKAPIHLEEKTTSQI